MEGDDDRSRQRHKVSTTLNSSRRGRKIVAFTGTAAIIAIVANFAFLAFKSRKNSRNRKELVGSNVKVKLSASEIRKLAEQIVAESKEVHDALASVPVDKVKYQDIMALAELEAQQFSMIQSCIFPRLVSMSDDVRKASAEAERRINTHFASSRFVSLSISHICTLSIH
ncbi:hypothetical protein Cgig2_024678 [Carnegiea gigantea]|uniref:Uncharacterized protein n=1 Tax=Carnegiea gigantea TaxID=171969 RepID=A0A9Q1K812_9CARY|nr:hypothetical protein Cgig2_024678 [Carnegiea gigantea]